MRDALGKLSQNTPRRKEKPDAEIYVRLAGRGMDFVYSVRRGGVVIESGLVPPAGRFTAPAIHGYQQAAPGPDDLELWGNPAAAQAFHFSLYGRP